MIKEIKDAAIFKSIGAFFTKLSGSKFITGIKKKISPFWQKKWVKIGTIVVFALLLLGGGFRVYQSYQSKQAAEEMRASIQTAPVEVGSLTESIEVTGNVEASNTATISWETSGRVSEVNVVAGQSVEEGAILASLAEDSLDDETIYAQVDYYEAVEALEDLYDSYGDYAIAEAEEAVADARDELESAEYTYNSLVEGESALDIMAAKADLIIAQDKLEEAQETWEKKKNKPETNLERANAVNSLASAQDTYDEAARIYSWYSSPASDIDLAVAKSDYDVAKQVLIEAEEDLEDLKAGPTETEILSAESKIDSFQALMDNAWLEAPFSGVITDVDVSPGNLVYAGTYAFQIDDIDPMVVDVQVTEVEINKVELGQRATLTFDAIDDKEYTGEISKVSLAGSETSGIVYYTITIAVADADEDVLVGMNAELEIIISEIEDATLVPNEAIQLNDDGSYSVYVMNNGMMQPMPVSIGPSSDTYTEVTEGELTEGDLVVISGVPEMTEEFMMRGMGMFGVMGGGGPPGGGQGGRPDSGGRPKGGPDGGGGGGGIP